MNEWRPIEEYDAMKNKPKHCVFWVEAMEGSRPGAGLKAMLVTERRYGFRITTHFKEVGAP